MKLLTSIISAFLLLQSVSCAFTATCQTRNRYSFFDSDTKDLFNKARGIWRCGRGISTKYKTCIDALKLPISYRNLVKEFDESAFSDKASFKTQIIKATEAFCKSISEEYYSRNEVKIYTATAGEDINSEDEAYYNGYKSIYSSEHGNYVGEEDEEDQEGEEGEEGEDIQVGQNGQGSMERQDLQVGQNGQERQVHIENVPQRNEFIEGERNIEMVNEREMEDGRNIEKPSENPVQIVQNAQKLEVVAVDPIQRQNNVEANKLSEANAQTIETSEEDKNKLGKLTSKIIKIRGMRRNGSKSKEIEEEDDEEDEGFDIEIKRKETTSGANYFMIGGIVLAVVAIIGGTVYFFASGKSKVTGADLENPVQNGLKVNQPLYPQYPQLPIPQYQQPPSQLQPPQYQDNYLLYQQPTPFNPSPKS